MNKKNIFNHLREQAQKAGQKVAKVAKEIADDSGLSTKEGREEFLKRTKEFASKTKESVQETALRGVSIAKKNVDKSIEAVQKKSNQLKEAVKKQKVGANSKEKTNKLDHAAKIIGSIAGIAIATAGIGFDFHNMGSPSNKSSSEHCAFYSLEEEYYMMRECINKNKYQHSKVVSFCANHIKELVCDKQKERNQGGYSTKTYQQSLETHCAVFSLEQEYHLMKICVESCYGNTLKCSEEIRSFECFERNTYDEAEQKAESCSIRDDNYY